MAKKSELVFNDSILKVVVAEIKRFNCPLLFVKNHGVYVMSAEGEKNSKGMPNVCYGNGFNPDTTDFYELRDRMRETCGGDDFVETLLLDASSIDILSSSKPYLKIVLSETEIEVTAGCL
ncbi:TPA: DUF3085 domain-containing protein [Escherichia coli]